MLNQFISIATLTIVFTILLSCSISIVKGETIHGIESLMNDIEYLHSRGVNVQPIIDMLNNAIKLVNEGRIDEAYLYINEARNLIEALKREAEPTYMRLLITKILSITILGVLPVLIYLLLPRIYLYLWFRFHRKWIIRW